MSRITLKKTLMLLEVHKILCKTKLELFPTTTYLSLDQPRLVQNFLIPTIAIPPSVFGKRVSNSEPTTPKLLWHTFFSANCEFLRFFPPKPYEIPSPGGLNSSPPSNPNQPFQASSRSIPTDYLIFSFASQRRASYRLVIAAMAAVQDPTNNTVIIGIDFGTTYSGVAFTCSKKIEHMEVISSWESDLLSNSDRQKTPTAISFAPKAKVDWGHGIPCDAEKIEWFKLLIVDHKDLPKDVQAFPKIKEARAYLKKNGKTAIEVIALFLRHLWNHAIQRITATVGRGLVNFSKFTSSLPFPQSGQNMRALVCRRRLALLACSETGLLERQS